MELKLIIEKTIPNMTVHWFSDGEILASIGYAICVSKDGGASFQKTLDLPVAAITSGLSKFRLASRALRLGVRTLIKLKSGTVLAAANRKLFRIQDGQVTTVYSFDKGFSPLRQGWCEDDKGNCYMTEYFLNNKRTTSSEIVKSSSDGKSWQVVHSTDCIRHIHCVQWDPFSRNIYMGTGDRDNESSISYSQDGGKTWAILGSGDQVYRAVSLLFSRDYIYWGGDAPTRQNYIVRCSRRDNKVEKLVPVNGTVFYSTVLKDGTLLFGTTDEGNSEGKNPTKDKKAHIWASQDGDHWEDIASWKKDVWPYLLGSGKVLFAQGESSDHLYFTTQALAGRDEVFTRARVVIS